MSKRKGLSLDEKRQKMLELFYDSADFFLLKELERMGPKKGVISQSVKDVIQSLVDDDMVLRDKIGTSVYFWSLPSSAGQKLRQEEAALAAQVEELKQQKTRLQEAVTQAQTGREEGDERAACMEQLNQLNQRHTALKVELAELAQNDPEVYEKRQNIFALQQWCNDNCPTAPEALAQLYHEVGISNDLDYVE